MTKPKKEQMTLMTLIELLHKEAKRAYWKNESGFPDCETEPCRACIHHDECNDEERIEKLIEYINKEE